MLAKLKAFVKDLASTNWLIFTGTVMGMLTGLAYIVAIFIEKSIVLDIWLAWLAFLAGWMGFGVRQFRHKRETNFELERVKRGNGSTVEPEQPTEAGDVR